MTIERATENLFASQIGIDEEMIDRRLSTFARGIYVEQIMTQKYFVLLSKNKIDYTGNIDSTR